MQLIMPLFIVNLLLVTIIVLMVSSPNVSAGCYMIGTEINGDGSIEYLMIGDCA